MISRRRFLAAPCRLGRHARRWAPRRAHCPSGAARLCQPTSRPPGSTSLDWHYRRALQPGGPHESARAGPALPRQREEPRQPVERPPFNRSRCASAACGRASRAAAPLRVRVLTPWHGTLPWRHWNQWSRHPPYDLAVTSVPALGPHDSRDPKVLNATRAGSRRAAWGSSTSAGRARAATRIRPCRS